MVGGQFSNFGAMGDYLNGRHSLQRTLSIRGTPLSAQGSANFALAGEGARPTHVFFRGLVIHMSSTGNAEEGLQASVVSRSAVSKNFLCPLCLFPCCTGAIGVTAGSSPACGEFGMTVLFIFIFLFL